MSSMLYLLSLCVITVIQLTSSQSTYDVIQHDCDVSSCCERADQALNQLMRMNSQLMNAVSELRTSMSQLQRDVDELKASNRQKDVRGKASCKVMD